MDKQNTNPNFKNTIGYKVNSIKTEDLEKVITSKKQKEITKILKENDDVIFAKIEKEEYSSYMRSLIDEKKLRQKDIFYKADIRQDYGYKIVSGEKATKKRDIYIRICVAAEFTVEETNRILKFRWLPELYVRVKRDALIINALANEIGDVYELNDILVKNGEEPLAVCGKDDD